MFNLPSLDVNTHQGTIQLLILSLDSLSPHLTHDGESVHVANLACFDPKLVAIRKTVRKGHEHVDAPLGLVDNIAAVCILDSAGNADIAAVSRRAFARVLFI